jgi:putative endonuclease
MFYVYVLRCSDGTLYTGYTVDVAERVKKHNDGTASKYTRSRRPVARVAEWQYATKSAALRAESAFKRLTRAEKIVKIGIRQQPVLGTNKMNHI